MLWFGVLDAFLRLQTSIPAALDQPVWLVRAPRQQTQDPRPAKTGSAPQLLFSCRCPRTCLHGFVMYILRLVGKMSVCMYVCTCAYLYIYAYLHTYIHRHILRMYLNIQRVYAQVYINVYMDVHMHTYGSIQKRTHF